MRIVYGMREDLTSVSAANVTLWSCVTLIVTSTHRTLANVTAVGRTEGSINNGPATPEQWLALHHAFRRYCEANPRGRLANEDVLAVNDPLGHFEEYCVALGDGGVAYGLGVYLGDQGLMVYLTTMTLEDEPYGVEMLERGRSRVQFGCR